MDAGCQKQSLNKAERRYLMALVGVIMGSKSTGRR